LLERHNKYRSYEHNTEAEDSINRKAFFGARGLDNTHTTYPKHFNGDGLDPSETAPKGLA